MMQTNTFLILVIMVLIIAWASERHIVYTNHIIDLTGEDDEDYPIIDLNTSGSEDDDIIDLNTSGSEDEEPVPALTGRNNFEAGSSSEPMVDRLRTVRSTPPSTVATQVPGACSVCIQSNSFSLTGHIVSCPSCHNKFHFGCLKRWFKNHQRFTCPYCRFDMHFMQSSKDVEEAMQRQNADYESLLALANITTSWKDNVIFVTHEDKDDDDDSDSEYKDDDDDSDSEYIE
jgi:hypothetical protein